MSGTAILLIKTTPSYCKALAHSSQDPFIGQIKSDPMSPCLDTNDTALKLQHDEKFQGVK
jgi:hypothetical protein